MRWLSRVVSPTAVHFCWLPQPFPGPNHCVSPFVRSTQLHILLWEDLRTSVGRTCIWYRGPPLCLGDVETSRYLSRVKHSTARGSAQHPVAGVQFSGDKCIHRIVHPSLLSVSRTFSSSLTNSVSIKPHWLTPAAPATSILLSASEVAHPKNLM